MHGHWLLHGVVPSVLTMPRPLDVPGDDGLAAVVDVHVLAFATVAVQRFHLRRERARQFVEGVRGTVLLRNHIQLCYEVLIRATGA